MRRWVILLIACAASLMVLACTVASGTATDRVDDAIVTCGLAKPDQNASQSHQTAVAAEAALAALRAEPRTPGQVIQIQPAASADGPGDDSAAIEVALRRARLFRKETGQPTTLAFAPGRYRLSHPIALTAADSGAPGAPLRFAALSGGPAIFTGGMQLARKPLPPALDGLLSAAQRQAVVGYAVPPKAVPSEPFPRRIGTVYTRSPSLFVLQGDRPIWRSSFPDVGYSVEPVAHPQPGPAVVPQVTVPRGLAQAQLEPSLQAGGYWTYDWAYEENRVALGSGNATARGRLSLVMPQLKTRYPQSPLMRYRLLNGFSFIDRPGEMAYADGALAVYRLPNRAPVEVATLDHLVTINGAHDIAFDGLALQGARQDVVSISEAHDITIGNAYLGLAAGSAITITRSDHVILDRSVVTDVGEYGVAMDSDARMPPSHVIVADSVFSRNAQLTRANRSAILLSGHDNVVIGNDISDLPHQAMVFGGARNLIIGNEISFVDLETGDAGAVYAYHDLTTAYNHITQNYLHDIATSPNLTQAGASRYVRDIYLDGWTSFTTIENNISNTEAMSYFINSGFGNTVTDNIWFLRGVYSGQIYDSSHHRGDALGHYVFDDPKSQKLASCSNLTDRFDQVFLSDGKPRNNVIVGNYNIGGQSILVPAALAKAQQIADEKLLSAAKIDRARGIAGLVSIARQNGAPIGAYLEAADRTSALQSLKYHSRKGG
jgi:hypothetical protein